LNNKHDAGKEEQQEVHVSETDVALAEVNVAAPNGEQPRQYASSEDAEIN